jgi:hypothetical protein
MTVSTPTQRTPLHPTCGQAHCQDTPQTQEYALRGTRHGAYGDHRNGSLTVGAIAQATLVGVPECVKFAVCIEDHAELGSARHLDDLPDDAALKLDRSRSVGQLWSAHPCKCVRNALQGVSENATTFVERPKRWSGYGQVN